MIPKEQINIEKQVVRTAIKNSLQTIGSETIQASSKIIFEQIERLSNFKHALTIMIYWSMPDEVYTHEVIQTWAKTKAIYLPSIKKDIMTPSLFTSVEELTPTGKLQIPEPKTVTSISPENIDLIIVPGLAFDKKKNRLGKGKGYYDRFLAETTAFKIGVCLPQQLVEMVPTEKFDIKMDMVVCG